MDNIPGGLIGGTRLFPPPPPLSLSLLKKEQVDERKDK